MRYRYREEHEMKDSGIGWIGKIPKDWEATKLKNIGNISTSSVDKKINEEEKIVSLVNYVDVYNSKTKELFNNDSYMKVSAKESQLLSSNLLKGDVLFTPSSETTHDIGYSAVVMEDLHNTLYSYHIVRLRFDKNINLNFKKYMFWSNSFLNYLSSRATGTTRKTLSINNFKDNIVILPRIEEQEKIANFLDEKTSQFDLIISKKEELIQRLEESKKSIISELVTGKIKVIKSDDGYELVKRSSDEIKDSGVEWLGQIPKDWDVKRIKYLFEIKKNIAGKLGYDVLSVTQSGIKIKDITKNEGQLSMDYSKYQLVDVGNFVMNHMDLLTGFVDCSNFKGVTSPDYRVFRLIDENNCKKYYNYIFQLCYHNKIFYSLAQGVSGMGRWRLQTDTFKNFTVPMPSCEEQEEIALALKSKIEDIVKLKNKLIVNIEKLKEAKQSLINEAVTGKIEILD